METTKIIISPTNEKAKAILAGLVKLNRSLIAKFEHTNLAIKAKNK